jgi:hypothetical protein
MDRRRPRRRDHLFDTKRITSDLMTKYQDANETIRKRISIVDKTITMLMRYKDMLNPTFLDFQLTQLIADAAHFVSVELGNRVVFSEATASNPGATSRDDTTDENIIDPAAPIVYDGGPCQFTQPGCEVACTIISLIVGLLYAENSSIPFNEFAETIKWPLVMRQGNKFFKLWRDRCIEKMSAKKIKSIPPYPTLDEIWLMPELKKTVAPYVIIDNCGYYKITERTHANATENVPYTTFVERLRRTDAVTRQRKETLVHIATSAALTITIISLYRPLSESVGYVIYDPHGTYYLNQQGQSHYAVNFRYDDTGQKAFLVEYPSLDILLEHIKTIPFCVIQEEKTELSKYTFSTISRAPFEF